MNRYSCITEKLPREMVLLQGRGCAWKRCTFCDYHLDISADPFEVNRRALANVAGRFGVLDVINSGSCVELDERTLAHIAQIAREKRIHTLWFEAHWMYREKLAEFAARFPGVSVKFRAGVESFDAQTRARWNKGIVEGVTPADIARYFQGVCLLIGVGGQTSGAISRDIEAALEHFEYFSVNAFVPNTTAETRDDALVDWFKREWLDKLVREPKAEVLLSNTDLGVG